jgi:hypothetical protein
MLRAIELARDEPSIPGQNGIRQGRRLMEWARILAYITGTVDQEPKLGEIGRRLGRKALGEVVAKAPHTTSFVHAKKQPENRR